ncbi:MAG: PIN domain-containing protein [Verrucomicrobiales bacterium]
MMVVESVLVDSNVFIDCLRAGQDPARELLARFELSDLVTCGVVKAEVLRGVRAPRVRDKLAEFFSVMRYVDSPLKIWDATWELAWQLDRRGRVLPLSDLAIATCARKAGAAVFTKDRHFDAIPELTVLKP